MVTRMTVDDDGNQINDEPTTPVQGKEPERTIERVVRGPVQFTPNMSDGRRRQRLERDAWTPCADDTRGPPQGHRVEDVGLGGARRVGAR